MTFFQELTSNQTLMTGVTGWVVAQVLKTILDIGLNHSFNPERLVGSGGMPSSHSSTVCSLATAAALRYGVGSFEFSISFILAMIVMYDAIGVRRDRKAGKSSEPPAFRRFPQAGRRGITGKIEGIRGAYADTGSSRRDFRHFDCIYSRSDVHITNIGSFHFG